MTLEFTDWARDILWKADSAARRINPDARVRLVSAPNGLQALLTDAPEDGDAIVEIDGASIIVQSGLAGLVDIVEPHDQIVLRPAGSTPTAREPHD